MEEMRQIRAEVEGVSLSDGTMVIVKRWVNLAVEPRAEELVDAKNITLEARDASVRMWQAYNHFACFLASIPTMKLEYPFEEKKFKCLGARNLWGILWNLKDSLGG